MSVIPSLPLTVYQTFVLEEKHGFNKTTPSLFVADTLKGWGLGFVIGAPFLAAFLYVFKWAGDRFVPWLMGFLSVFLHSLSIPRLTQPQIDLSNVYGHSIPDRHPAALQQTFTSR